MLTRGLLGDRGEQLFDLGLDRLEVLAAGHDRDHLVARDFRLAVGAAVAAPIEQGEHVADRIGVVDVVADEDDRQAAHARLDDELQHHRRLMHAERRGRLIED